MPRRSAGSGLLFRYTRIPRPETDPIEKSENPDPNRQSGAKVGIDFIDAGEIAETREHDGCFNCIRQCGAGLARSRQCSRYIAVPAGRYRGSRTGRSLERCMENQPGPIGRGAPKRYAGRAWRRGKFDGGQWARSQFMLSRSTTPNAALCERRTHVFGRHAPAALSRSYSLHAASARPDAEETGMPPRAPLRHCTATAAHRAGRAYGFVRSLRCPRDVAKARKRKNE